MKDFINLLSGAILHKYYVFKLERSDMPHIYIKIKSTHYFPVYMSNYHRKVQLPGGFSDQGIRNLRQVLHVAIVEVIEIEKNWNFNVNSMKLKCSPYFF